MSLVKFRSSVNLGLPSTPLASNSELNQELVRVYNAIRSLAVALDSYTGALAPESEFWAEYKDSGIRINGLTKVYYPAYENLVYGNTVAFYNDAGTVKVRKADGATYLCRGFCSVVAGVSTGEICEVTLIGLYPLFPTSTLTAGTTYYQSATAGQIGATGPQKVGYALDDRNLFFNPDL